MKLTNSLAALQRAINEVGESSAADFCENVKKGLEAVHSTLESIGDDLADLEAAVGKRDISSELEESIQPERKK